MIRTVLAAAAILAGLNGVLPVAASAAPMISRSIPGLHLYYKPPPRVAGQFHFTRPSHIAPGFHPAKRR